MVKAIDRVEGGCPCGKIRFRVAMPSRFCAHCHCTNCRRAHGAAFVTWVGFRREQVEILAGEPTRYVTDTGATRSFCPRCGCTLFYEGPRWKGELHVVLSNIDGDIDRLPESHVHVDDRATWWTIQDSLPQYGGQSGTEPKDADERGSS